MRLRRIYSLFCMMTFLSTSPCLAQSTTDSGEDAAADVESSLGGSTYDISLSKGRHWFFATLTQQTGSIEFAEPDDSSSNVLSGEATTTVGADTAQETLAGTWYGLDLSFLTLWLVSGTDDTNYLLAYGYQWDDVLTGRAYRWGSTQGRFRLEGQLSVSSPDEPTDEPATDEPPADDSSTDGSSTDGSETTSDSGSASTTN